LVISINLFDNNIYYDQGINMPKLTVAQLRKIISEEVQILREGEKEDQAAAMATSASKLLKAIESFKAAASAKAKSSMDSSGTSLERHLQLAEKMLKRIVESPMMHVDGPKAPPPTAPSAPAGETSKKVTLKPSGGDA